MTMPRAIAQHAEDERGGQRDDTERPARSANARPRRMPTKPSAAQQRDHADRADQRHGAALPRGARRAEIGEGDDQEGERIERRVIRSCSSARNCPAARLYSGSSAGGFRQFPRSAFLHANTDRAPALGDRRDRSNAYSLERTMRIALAGFLPLHGAVLEHQEGAALVGQDVAPFGEDGRRVPSGRAGRRPRCRAAGRSARARGCGA